ncbi:MAG: 5-methyltetrahydropteroyltriglutamate--homocysteine S-methyltransferase [Pseudomonadota bacterium]|uniref:5-methyltetrahydropteroyltriglutamate-- homocysteine S-methyltransferase n=1 Tax=Phenylobacterium sp. TaxID=1871053 RepID=UPI0025D73D1B|nr:5-methyltetrahydropteroyltriglutamate--homocysteine S-methyltransferase [Phenylobacterium sp.]MBT9471729.1 5-methyltetrahydropteroyltriglutamate--homocysteine S-methyltransferase [Phenylobacterium sp.]
MPVTIATLGFPRIGPRRELKFALERYWSGKSSAETLEDEARALRAGAWSRQRSLGVDHVPSNDFSLYDHVLDMSAVLGAVPQAYRAVGTPLETYFAMARGRGAVIEACAGHTHSHGGDLPAQEMTKWFDTNYHYVVPRLSPGQTFELTSTKPVDEFLEAKALGVTTRPVLVGPVSYLKLGKATQDGFDPLSLLDGVLPVYAELLRRLAAAGAASVQLDEPCLVLDLTDVERAALRRAYGVLADAAPGLKIMLTTYFGGLGPNLSTAVTLPVDGLHLDLVRAPGQLADALAQAPADLTLSLGVVDGRNIWRANLSNLLQRLEPAAAERRGLILAPSCSLLHTPLDLAQESALDPDVRGWLAFAAQKARELDVLRRGLNEGRSAVRAELEASDAAVASRRSSPKIHDPAVQARVHAVTPRMARREGDFSERRAAQAARLNLPAYPTTTIGSFPQTQGVRKARAAHDKRALSDADYDAFLRAETLDAVRWQEEIGLDVLVHGEFERNDMVQYFGERLSGFAFTQNAWVQSYGSRCVRPPIIFGDISRPAPMTVGWWAYAQSLTDLPMKGMLTGPVTILQWSFVRDDISRSQTCRQIALALRDEVVDLEAAGAKIIQVDEAALREGLPLQRADWPVYLGWAIGCFRLAVSGVRDETQIHTHMCYSDFNDIIEAIAAMDADVISIETARSQMELLEAFSGGGYPNEIGPGVYDIHAPRTPSVDEMVELLRKAGERLAPDQLWVNPDCGLKTRKWEEVRPALVNMVTAARRLREPAA